MTTRLMFLCVLFATLFLASCKKEVKEGQVRQDVDQFYISMTRQHSSGNLNCSFSISDVSEIEKLSRDEKVELKVRLVVTKNCVRKENLSISQTIAGTFDDNMANREPGIFVYQECLSLSYEIFDNGFKLRNTSIDDSCPESADFKASQKTRLDTLLKETALAACTCKHEKCEPGMMEDACGIKAERDLNGDGLVEILVGDTCGGNAYICGFRLWSLLNGLPTIIFEDTNLTDLQEIKANSNGKFPVIESTDISYDEKFFYLYGFSEKSKLYQLIKKG